MDGLQPVYPYETCAEYICVFRMRQAENCIKTVFLMRSLCITPEAAGKKNSEGASIAELWAGLMLFHLKYNKFNAGVIQR